MRTLAALALVVGVLATSASATSGEYVDLTCPVCGNRFQGWDFHSTNTFGGCDRDGCEHAAGGQVFLKICWTCPACHYTALSGDWESPDEARRALVAKLKKKRFLQALAPIDPELQRTTDIPARVRWDLHLQMLEHLDPPAGHLFGALLHTAWTQRFSWQWSEALSDDLYALADEYRSAARARHEERTSPFVRDMEAAEELRRDADDADLPLTHPERQRRLLAAAWLLKRRGEDVEAEQALTLLARHHPKAGEAVRHGAAEIERRIATERRYLERAVPVLETMLRSDEISTDNRPWARLRLAELQWKTGKPKEAIRILRALSASKTLGEEDRAEVGSRLAEMEKSRKAAAAASD